MRSSRPTPCELLNHSISTDDLISGKTITDVMAQTAAQRQARQALPLTDEAKAMSSGDARSHRRADRAAW